MNAVGQIDAGLAERLHADEPAKPFTVSALHGGKRRGHEVAVAPGHACHVRFTSLDAALSDALLDGSASEEHPLRPGRALRIGGADFTIAALHSSADDHARAGRDSYEALARRFTSGEATHDATLPVSFDSPTTFKRGSRSLPLPVPALVFGGVMRKWQQHAPPSLRDVFGGWALDGDAAPVLLKRHDLHTHMLLFGKKGQQAGFSGEATFQLPEDADARFGGLLQLLGAFAFYAGIGYRTPWGMGQVRIGTDQ
jgi:CRISPR-associated endoribonuclease Cas6